MPGADRVGSFNAFGAVAWRHPNVGEHCARAQALYGVEQLRHSPDAGLGVAVVSDSAGPGVDDWALSATRLVRALDRFRLSERSNETAWVDPGGLDEALLRELTEAYESLLQSHGAVGYPAMLLLPIRLLEQEPRALRTLQDTYRHVLVDEVQDTCRLQYGLLRRIAGAHRNLALVGDPLQSVYSFRGAEPALLDTFAVDYPDARVYVLDENHRSTGTIVSLANAIAEPLSTRPASWTSNPQGPVARLYRARDELDEARYVADAIVKLLDEHQIGALGQAAVLFRTNGQAPALADAMRARGIAVQMRADSDLFARAEVRDLLAYLRLAHNPHDAPALARILDTPPRRLRDIERAFRKHPVPIVDLPAYAQRRGGHAAKDAAIELLQMLEEVHAAADGLKPVAVLETILGRTKYAVWLAAQKDGTDVDSDEEERRLTYVALSRCQVMLYLTYCEARRRTGGAQAGALDLRKPSRYLRALPPSLVHVAS